MEKDFQNSLELNKAQSEVLSTKIELNLNDVIEQVINPFLQINEEEKNTLEEIPDLNNLTIDERIKFYNEVIQENNCETGTVGLFGRNLLKNIVSKNKIRFSHHGYDLDLSYITDRIIAMGYPADNYEKIFRNSKEETLRFFEERHKEHYKIYNLCSERSYPENTFFSQGYFPFDDHEAPPINLMFEFCQDLKNWLDTSPLNIAGIHCKAGKGRTGTMICCFLVYIKFFDSAEKALKYYGSMRTYNEKGVTIPSQIRYVKYFERILNMKLEIPIENFPKVSLKLIAFNSLPNYGKINHCCTPYFKVFNGANEDIYKFKNHHKKKTFYLGENIEFPVENLELKGDVKIIFYNKKMIGKEKMFKFWFNTFFVPSNGLLTFKKIDLDKACKDKKNLLYFENFNIDLFFKIENEEFEKKEKYIITKRASV